jgi:hypothetical protein
MTDFTFNILMTYIAHPVNNLSNGERERNKKTLERIKKEEELTGRQMKEIGKLIKFVSKPPFDLTKEEKEVEEMRRNFVYKV